MTSPLLAVARGYARTGLRLWWDVLCSGAFFGRWTLAVSFLVSITALGMYVQADSPAGYVRGLFLSIVVWILAVVLLVPVAFAERRVHDRNARGVLVAGAVLVVSLARPILHDLVAFVVFGAPVHAGWGPRMFTNAVTWLPALSIVAAAALGYRAARVTHARLSSAIEDLARARQRLHDYTAENENLVAESVSRLRRQRERMLAGAVDFDAVSAYSAEVRAASHRFDDRSRAVLDPPGPPRPVAAKEVRPIPVLARLRPPPLLLVGVLVFAGSAAHIYELGGIGSLLLAALVVPAAGLAADILTRRMLPRARPRARGVWFLVIWTAAGALVMLAGTALVPGVGIERLAPVVAFPGIALAAALGADAVHRASVNIRRLTTLLEADAQELAGRSARSRARMRSAADLLHGRVQGKCVLLAAAADEREVTAAELDGFRSATDQAFADLESGSAEATPAEVDVPTLLAAWAGVLRLTQDVDASATDALHDADVRRRATDVLNEALVNVVKHAGARVADVRIAGDAGGVRIRVASPGTLRTGGHGRGIATLPGRASLRQEAGDVVLTVDVAATPEAPMRPEPGSHAAPAAGAAEDVLRYRW